MVWNTDGVYCKVIIPGGETQVRRSEDFKTSVVNIARGTLKLAKFSVFIDGKEIDPEEAPSNFENIEVVEIRKYDEFA